MMSALYITSRNGKIAVIIIVGLFVAYSIVREFYKGDCTDLVQKFLTEEFKGRVVKKEKIKNRNNTPVIYLEGRINPIYVWGMSSVGLYEQIEVGDYVFKSKNELRCGIVKGADTIFIFKNVPDCAKFIKNDR